MGYQVIDSASVIATHVNKIVAAIFLIYLTMTILRSCIIVFVDGTATGGRFERSAQLQPVLKVYRALLTEGVSLRDIVTMPLCWSPVAH